MKYFFIGALTVGSIAGQSDQSVQNLARFIQANYYQFGNDLKQAAFWYAQITPDEHVNDVYAGYIPFLYATQEHRSIAQLIDTLDPHFKKNNEIQMIFAQSLEKIGQHDKAHGRLIELNQQNKSNQELAFKVAQLYMERKEPENALLVIDNFLNSSSRRPNNFIFQFLRAQIFLQCQKPQEALAATKRCIELYPKFDKSWLLYAILHEQEGRLEKAIQGYTTYLELTTDSRAQIQQHLIALTIQQEMLVQKKSIAVGNCFEQALQLLSQKNFEAALSHAHECLKQNPDNLQARILIIQILAEQNKSMQAAQLLSSWMAHGLHQELWMELMHTLTYAGLPYATAASLLKKHELHINNKQLYALYQADLALRLESKDALPLLEKALALATEPSLKIKIAFQIALIWYDKKLYSKAQHLLESIDSCPSFAPACNLLAYLYAQSNTNLDTAVRLIQTALHADQKNPHFLDTYAVILYKQKKFNQALALYDILLQRCPDDKTIQANAFHCKRAFEQANKNSPTVAYKHNRTYPSAKKL